MRVSDDQAQTKCPLVTEFLYSWAVKEMSAVTVQRFAAAALESGVTHAEMIDLAKIVLSSKKSVLWHNL